MTVCIIPARGGSVRIPRKNVRLFHGKPIIAYSIETAKASGLFESVIVSTDDEEISEIAQNCGADVMIRGPQWSEEHVGPLDVARHCLTLMQPTELVCVIYATAPLMSLADLVTGYYLVKEPGVAYAFSAASEPFLHDSAQFFYCRTWALREKVPEFGIRTRIVPIVKERDCDINDAEDWALAEKMYEALYATA